MEVKLNVLKARGYDIHEALRFGENEDNRHALQRMEACIQYAEGVGHNSADLDEVDIEEFFGLPEKILEYAA